MAVDFGIKWNAFLQTGEFDFFFPLKLQIQSERSSNDWLILSLVRPGGLDVGSTTHCSARTGISTFNHQVQKPDPTRTQQELLQSGLTFLYGKF